MLSHNFLFNLLGENLVKIFISLTKTSSWPRKWISPHEFFPYNVWQSVELVWKMFSIQAIVHLVWKQLVFARKYTEQIFDLLSLYKRNCWRTQWNVYCISCCCFSHNLSMLQRANHKCLWQCNRLLCTLRIVTENNNCYVLLDHNIASWLTLLNPSNHC